MNDKNIYTLERNGTYYHKDTPPRLIVMLECIRQKRIRCIFVYNDGTIERGRIGRSTGREPIPLLIKTSRSTGGFALSTVGIKEIRNATDKSLLYSI